MGWKLIDPKKTVTKTIQGQKVIFKVLTNGQKQRIARLVGSIGDDGDEAGFDGTMEAIAEGIESIGTIKGEALKKYLPAIADIEIQMELMQTVLGVNSLTGKDVGNSKRS